MARSRQTSLRLTDELLERLKQAAADNRRTLGAEISLRLEQSFEPHEPADVLREIAAASKTLAEAGSRLGRGDDIDRIIRRTMARMKPASKKERVE